MRYVASHAGEDIRKKLTENQTKPICGQCRKSNRECVPSEGVFMVWNCRALMRHLRCVLTVLRIVGVAFRHAQNAGFVDKNGESLKSFYKYRQKFENTYFVPIPNERTYLQKLLHKRRRY